MTPFSSNMEAFRRRPDPALAAAGLEGEMLVARVRLVVMTLLLVTPTWKLVKYPEVPIFVWGFGVTFGAALAALGIWWLLRRGPWRPWIGFASSALDVSLVSAALWIFMLVGSPLVALHSKVTYEIYFLAILATSLRYDARICVAVGLLAIAEYGGMWAWAAHRYDLNDPALHAGTGVYAAVDQITRLILLAAATLLALAVVRRAQRLLQLAVRDRLTGVYNRGQFDVALAHEAKRAVRYGHELAVALIDLDHFKRINDTYGHTVGDQVLIEIAARLARAVRSTDLVARYGGEEFGLLLPQTGRTDATRRIDALREQIAAVPMDVAGRDPIPVTFSAGIALVPTDGESPAAVLDRADARLFAAKRAGRNRVHDRDKKGDALD